jgi:hypothetical protein
MSWHFEPPEREDDGAALHREEELEEMWWDQIETKRDYWESLRQELKEMLNGR